MTFFKIAATVFLMGGSVTAAQAATYDFTGIGGYTDLGTSNYFTSTDGTGPGVTVTAGAAGFLVAPRTPTVTQTFDGLGVHAGGLLILPDLQPGQLDGNPLNTNEWLTFTFDWAVDLMSFGLRDTGGILGLLTDQYNLRINGGAWSSNIQAEARNLVQATGVTSFSVRAGSRSLLGGLLEFDDYTVSSIELMSPDVAAVPVPAAGLLLAGALGGLAMLRRRKAA